jgi:RNA-directed DNA polymerase
MTANSMNMTGAFPDNKGHWHKIKWSQCFENIERLQVRIVKAIKCGRWGKVKALQRLLTHSFSGKAIAVRRVTENRGKKTPGVDSKIWSTPSDKYNAILSLKSRGYKASTLRRVYIPKLNGKQRPLSIPTMKDRAMQALYAMALDPIAESKGDKNSYGFRKARSTADAIQKCFVTLSKRRSAQWILEADIEGCFDNISHEWLMKHIPMDKRILREWLNAGFMSRKVFHPTEHGTPQGGIISPILANMTLDGLEKLISDRYPVKRMSPDGEFPKVNLVRYADDFITTARTREMLEEEIIPLIKDFLAERGLKLSAEKTKITHIDDGFDFLGQSIRKYNGKLLIRPSQTSIERFLKTIRKFMKENKTRPQDILILALNPKIKGWCQYHRHVASKRTFRKIGHELWKACWHWAKSRHLSKGKQWIKDKYFIHDGKRDWCFSSKIQNKRVWNKESITLYAPERIPIKRHIKIKSECNPYDPNWGQYLLKRNYFKSVDEMKRKGLYRIWKSQRMICPVCKQQITLETGWDVHHILKKSKGGDDSQSNLMLLHLNCHKQIHNQEGVIL